MTRLKDISMITYTNHVMEDAWDIYFEQLDKFSKTKQKHLGNHTVESLCVGGGGYEDWIPHDS